MLIHVVVFISGLRLLGGGQEEAGLQDSGQVIYLALLLPDGEHLWLLRVAGMEHLAWGQPANKRSGAMSAGSGGVSVEGRVNSHPLKTGDAQL